MLPDFVPEENKEAFEFVISKAQQERIPIENEQDVIATQELIKTIKGCVLNLKLIKKEKELPFETARKLADAQLKQARDGKKEAGSLISDMSKEFESLEFSLRTSLSKYVTEIQRKEQEKLEEEQRLLEEVRQKQIKAEAAEREHQVVKNEDSLSEMDEAIAKSETASAEYQEVAAAPKVTTKLAYRANVSIEVEDIDRVPDIYFYLTPDRAAIQNRLDTYFEGMNVNLGEVFITNSSLASDVYTIQELNVKELTTLYKSNPDINIPGIKRVITQIPIVR